MIKSVYKYCTIPLVLLFFFISTANLKAQVLEKDYDPYENVVQLSGIVLGSDSTNGVPGVHIYSPKTGRGTTTNLYGYFSLPLLKGDSVVVSALGFAKKHFVVPSDKGDGVSVVIELNQDTTYLEEIQIFPYPTEELFKEAILALELPYAEDLNSLDNFLNEDIVSRMYWSTEASPETNHRFFMQQQFNANFNRFQRPVNPLLNPFAWAQFIKSVKRGDLKKNK